MDGRGARAMETKTIFLPEPIHINLKASRWGGNVFSSRLTFTWRIPSSVPQYRVSNFRNCHWRNTIRKFNWQRRPQCQQCKFIAHDQKWLQWCSHAAHSKTSQPNSRELHKQTESVVRHDFRKTIRQFVHQIANCEGLWVGKLFTSNVF